MDPLLERVNGLCHEVELLRLGLDELAARFESVHKLAELLVRHEDRIRGGGGEDLVEGL
jgi:hypothetical protein